MNYTPPASLVSGAMSIGGTVGRWAFGTAALTSGVGTIATGLGTVIAANAQPTGVNIGLGTITSLQLDLSLATSGSIILRGMSAVTAFGANSTVSWMAFGL